MKTRQQHMREGLGSRIFDKADVLLILSFLLVVLLPLIHVVMASLSNPLAYAAHEGLLLWPLKPTLMAYRAVARNKNILIGYGNTLFVVGVGTAVNMVMTIIAAYCLSRKNVMFRNIIILGIVFTMYFSGGMIPFYLVVKNLGLTGTRWSLIIPSAMNTYNLIIMRTAMASVPESLEESAKLDGANHWQILWDIMVHLVKPTLAVILLYYVVSNWNAWFNAMLFIRDRRQYPLQLILREILIQNDTTDMTAGMAGDEYLISETIQFATIVAATAPVLCLYPFIQKYFVKGVMIGAVKE